MMVLNLVFLMHIPLFSDIGGYKYFKNFSYMEYDHHPQNWCIAQDRNGIIYVGNQAGVLVYDGVSWQVIDIPNHTARSLAIDEKGIVYIGGNNEIGRLLPDAQTSLRYESLLKYVDQDCRNFANIWRTYATKEGIYFMTTNYLFRWDGKKMKTWGNPDSNFRSSFVCGGDFYIQRQDEGLMKLAKDSLQLVPAGRAFANEKIWMMAPYDSSDKPGTMLLCTREKGFFLYDGENIMPFAAKIDDSLLKTLYCGTRLSSGEYALATLGNGLIIMDAAGNSKYVFNKSDGLQNGMVKHVFEDNQGNLWLSLDKGITRIEYRSPFFLYDERTGIPGMILSIARCRGELFVGATDGLYVMRTQPQTFQLKAGISSSCNSLLPRGASLLAATAEGVFQIEPRSDTKKQALKDYTFVLQPSALYPNRTWCGTARGLVALKQENGLWIEEHRFTDIDREIRSIMEDPKGYLWLTDSTGGILRADFRIFNKNPKIDSYTLVPGETQAVWAAGHGIFTTEKGIFRFAEKENNFIPDLILGKRFAGALEEDKKGEPVFRLVEDRNKQIWFTSESRNYRAIPNPTGVTIYHSPFSRIPLIQVNAIYPDPDGQNTWFGSMDGLIRYDSTARSIHDLDFPVFIRRVSLDEETSITGDYRQSIETRTDGTPLSLSYKNRNISFTCIAPFFQGESASQYRYFLEGYNNGWSDWIARNQRNYTNLDAGKYTFHVQARNVYGKSSDEKVFRFKILPPWYQTPLAFFLYVVGTILAVYGIVKWRSFKLALDKRKLEKIIKERTRELNDKNIQLETQTRQLKEQSEKLDEMDKMKSRFFANISHEFRTPLTLIMSPLENMLTESQEKEKRNILSIMMRNSRRLLTLINQLLDLSRFDSGKVRPQVAQQNIVQYLKGIISAFYHLAQQKKLDLKFQADEEEIPLYFDASKMDEVFNNLLINAVKFTPPKGEIIVSVSRDMAGQKETPDQSLASQEFVQISVRDTGIGIPKEQLGRIFDRFFQAENIKEDAYKGTGIGLALAKEIITLHHGTIDVHSQEGKWAEFVIRLPLGQKHFKPDEIATIAGDQANTRQPVEMKSISFSPEQIQDELEESCESAGSIPDVSKPGKDEASEQDKNVILVVEDHGDMRRHIRSSLVDLYEVVEAADGKQGIARAKEIVPDLIISDVMMPEVDGYELCRVLKKDIATSHIPIIMLTAKASEESAVKGLETGADDYITKPFNTKMLLSRIKNLIELRRQLQLKIQREKMLLPAEISVSTLDDEFLKKFQGIIEENLDDSDFRIDNICETLEMARSTLFKKIRALTGETPNDFIQSYRLERAAQILREDKSRSIMDVALDVGFSGAPYFAKCFKERFNQSPHEYQASHADQAKNP